MTDFPPIAIVGMSCVLPGALSPRALWEHVLVGSDLLSRCPPGYWGLSSDPEFAESAEQRGGRISSDRGGYVRGFEDVFDPNGFNVPPESLLGLDPLFHWVLWGCREALRDAGHDCATPHSRAGLVLGNLGYPSSSMTRYAESVWLETSKPDPRNRFHLALPPRIAAQVLKLGLGGFSIDAACASSLYALKLACDRLHDGVADLMIAGGVNRADDLFLHTGFTALNALSPTGQSRPFHRDADGLVPAEGAAFVALKRVPDALAAGDRIHAVIRGIGLGNDGRSAGLLSPAEDGQVRAMAAAYAVAGLRPEEIGLVECHATGTQVGDAVEIRSMSRVFRDSDDLAIGSLKSNLGHLITASGAAALIKVVEALKAGILPSTRSADNPAVGVQSSRFRLLSAPEEWKSDRPRIGAVSGFGFGGNNAHVILEEWQAGNVPQRRIAVAGGIPQCGRPLDPLAICGLGVVAGAAENTHEFARSILNSDSLVRDLGSGRHGAVTESVRLSLTQTRFPPRDLEQTLPQQLMLLKAAEEALEGCDLSGQRTGVFAGIEVDAEITRHGLRWRLTQLMREKGVAVSPEWLAKGRAGVIPPLEGPARIVGNMPNMPANRLNSQFDLAGPGFTIGAGRMSGAVALELATRALRANEIDIALVCAVDLSCERIHEFAVAETDLQHDYIPGDAAVVLVLRRLADPRESNSPIYCSLQTVERSASLVPSFGIESENGLRPLVGEPFASAGLLHLAAAIVCCSHAALIPKAVGTSRPWLPHAGTLAAEVALPLPRDPHAAVLVTQAGTPLGSLSGAAPRLSCYSGMDRREVVAALRDRRESNDGPARLVVLGSNENQLEERRQAAKNLFACSPGDWSKLPPEGVFYSDDPGGRKLALVFTGASAAYSGMGRELLAALPELGHSLGRRFRNLRSLGDWIYERSPEIPPTAEEQLCGCSLLCQLHAELVLGVLGIKPDAVLGLSSGETNSLFATGAWQDIDGMFEEIHASGMYDRELCGEFATARRAWGLGAGDDPVDWTNLRVLSSADRIREALAGEERAHLLIVHAPGDCLIGGELEACKRVLGRLGAPAAFASPGLVVHCPEMTEFAGVWRKLHTRPTSNFPNLRFYSNAICDAYVPSADTCAEMLLTQAQTTVDFARTVEKAWEDGVRIFVEVGPRNLCADWISKTLGDKPHVAVSLDRFGRSSLEQACSAIARLVAAGVKLDHEKFFEKLAGANRKDTKVAADRVLTVPAHPACTTLPPLPERPSSPDVGRAFAPTRQDGDMPQRMAPAPPLPFDLDDYIVLPRAATPISAAATQAAEAHVAVSGVHVASQMALGHADAAPCTAIGELASSIAASHAQALSAQVQVLQTSLESRLHALNNLRGASVARIKLDLPVRPIANRNHGHSPVHGNSSSSKNGDAPSPAEQSRREPALLQMTEPPVEQIRPPSTQSGKQFSREQLQVHAVGKISSIFGPLFRQQDAFVRQVRMPEPPLLLADRVTNMTGEAGSMGVGSIWTETDIRKDSWFVREGHIPVGILIESGQADLFLISWLGVDFLNRDERKYRMLSCDVTFYGGLPKVGDTLCYDIHIDHHANVGDVRLFFFHFDCRVNGEVRLRMRGGQAGFFTDQELAESAGVLWAPESERIDASAPCDAPVIVPQRHFTRTQVQSFAEGRAWECFGDGYEHCATHTSPPRMADGQLLLLQEVVEIDPRGGPWKRGYMSVVNRIAPDDWYFRGHFKNDPCMPGTLMAEAGMQAMSFYLAALGFTLEHDGWRFEPVAGEEFPLRCRGQVTPTSRELVYEVFVRELTAGPIPTLYADILGTVDGVKAIHGRRMGLRLVPDWPMEGRIEVATEKPVDVRPVSEVNGFRFGAAAMAACSLGRPSDAFGEMYRRFDGPTRVARLPGPPYNFVSRISRVEGEQGGMRLPAFAEAECDLEPTVWYFAENARRVMPLCVLMEAALQPCGWLASYIGCASTAQEELFFRNLDGTATLHSEVGPGDGVLTTRTRLMSLSRSAGITLVSFEVECRVGERLVYTMKTGFGFFPKESLAAQAGLPVTAGENATRIHQASNIAIDLRLQPQQYFSGTAKLPGGKLLMLDRVTGFWPSPAGGELAYLRSEKDVDPAEWFFKAHFFQDPVQPGTLGIEAMIQLLQFFALHTGLDRELPNARFEPLALNCELVWKYRGQVLPKNKKITTEAEIREIVRNQDSITVVADARLWADDMRIYQARGMAIRLVSQPETARVVASFSKAIEAVTESRQTRARVEHFTLDPDRDTWVHDHCPNYILPALPLMDVANRLAQAVQHASVGRVVTGLRDVQLLDWIVVDRPRAFRSTVEEAAPQESSKTVASGAGFFARLEGGRADPSGEATFQAVVEAHVNVAAAYPQPPAPFPPLTNLREGENPYRSGSLFHGPAFQVLRELQFGDEGASAVLDASHPGAPAGLLHAALLDGVYHAIPNDDLHSWSPEIPADQMAFPYRLNFLNVYGPTPTAGSVQCEVRKDGFDGGPRFPAFRIQLSIHGRIWADIRAVHILVPKGPIGVASRAKRRGFLRDRQFVDGVALSTHSEGITEILTLDVAMSDWLAGSVAKLYNVDPGTGSLASQVAIKEHIARKLCVHPGTIAVAGKAANTAGLVSPNNNGKSVGDAHERYAIATVRPLTRYPVRISARAAGKIQVADAGKPKLDLAAMWNYWVQRSAGKADPRIGEFLFNVLEHFVDTFAVTDSASLRPLVGSPVLFLGNHQTLLEPFVFSVAGPLLTGSPIVALAKIQQRESLLVQTLFRASARFSGMPEIPIMYFDRSDPGSLIGIVQYLKKMMTEENRSALIHVEGIRSLSCRLPVKTVSGVLFDLAAEANVPIVPIRFTGGLPVSPAPGKLDFPWGLAKQQYILGPAIHPDELSRLTLLEKKQRVLSAINGLGLSNEEEVPAPANLDLLEKVRRRVVATGVSETEAVLLECAGLPYGSRISELMSSTNDQHTH